MNAEQRIMRDILIMSMEDDDRARWEGKITADNVDDVWDEFSDCVWDCIYDFRCGDVETDIECDWSRHYESKSVASKLSDGTWVGWTYWYGGGKHGDPEGIPWLDEAYELDVTEEEKLVTIRTFKKRD